MTDTTEVQGETATTTTRPARRSSGGGGLGGKVIAELQQIATELGIEGVTSMRKGALIDAIKAARAEAKPAASPDSAANTTTSTDGADAAEAAPETPKAKKSSNRSARAKKSDKPQQDKQAEQQNAGQQNAGQQNVTEQAKAEPVKTDQNNKPQQNKPQQDKQAEQQNGQGNAADGGDDEAGGRRRNRRGRGRGNRGADGEVQVTEDDVLVPAAGIVDILDNYAFVRTTGYLPSENDVYVSLSMVRKWGLRRGDAVVGQVRQPREGERKEKFNPMVRVDSVNGMSLDEAKQRAEFDLLTPVFPTERLALETDRTQSASRLADLFAPIGKGQRALVVGPPASGRTTLLREVASAVTANSPGSHLMIVLVDERPEEVTEFQRTVKGEVIASGFDRPAGDHTTVAELAIERAKRLVELGHDVVVLLDGISRLARAYQQAATGQQQGRGANNNADAAESAALLAPKRLLGAARKLEDAGSLTLLATVLTGTGAALDEQVYAATIGAANSVVRLSGEAAGRRIFPAIDIAGSGTRRDDELQSAEELAVVARLRASVAGQDEAAATQTVLAAVDKYATNADLVARS